MRRLLLLAVLAAVVALGGSSALPGLGGRGEATRSGARVVRVIDGDTLAVRVGGREELKKSLLRAIKKHTDIHVEEVLFPDVTVQ